MDKVAVTTGWPSFLPLSLLSEVNEVGLSAVEEVLFVNEVGLSAVEVVLFVIDEVRLILLPANKWKNEKKQKKKKENSYTTNLRLKWYQNL